MAQYEVIVSNVGSVYEGQGPASARHMFDTYVRKSKEHDGRAADESVALLKDGDIIAEYRGLLDTDD